MENEPGIFNFQTDDPDQTAVLGRLRSLWIKQAVYSRTNFLIAWHGCSLSTLNSILRGGMADLRKTDGGYFGTGVYLTPQAPYAITYALQSSESTPQGEKVLLLAVCVTGLAYPLTRKFDYVYPDVNERYAVSNFHPASPISEVAVKKGDQKLITTELLRRLDKGLKSSFDAHFIGVSSKWFYQAAPIAQIEYDEIVLKEDCQVLPLAIVYFKPIA
jgi:hypothetical protein